MSKRLIYVYDALCGWCFGFSPVMKRLAAAYPNVPIEVISGGLMLGERVGPIGVVAPYVKSAYRDVEKRTGVRFGTTFLESGLADGSLMMNSMPPAIALCIFREQFPEKALTFAHGLHDMIYVQGHSPENHEALCDVAAEHGFDRAIFSLRLSEEKYHDLAKQDFMHARQLQATSYPQLIAEAADGQLYLVAKGYTPVEDLFERLSRVWNEAK